MGKKKKAKTSVTVYGMSIHFGVCAGPVDYMSNLIVDEKQAWGSWPSTIGGLTTYQMTLPDLFGGLGKEGGLEGNVTWLPGADDQVMPEQLAAKFGLTAATMPAYRGISSIFFWGEGRKITEFGGNVDGGFYWRANSPYLPGVWVEVARASEALEIPHARIWRSLSGDLSNPGHDLGLVGTGNDAGQWDSYGKYAVWAENHKPIKIWNIYSGAMRTLSPYGDWYGGGTIHLNDLGDLVLRQGGSFSSTYAPSQLDFYDIESLELVTSIPLDPIIYPLGAVGQNYGFTMDDITIGGDNWAIAVLGGVPPQVILLLKNRTVVDAVLSTTDLSIYGPVCISMGPQYAYARYVEDATTTYDLVRIGWDSSGITSQVNFGALGGTTIHTHYFEETDEVVILRGGDIYVYSPDLSTLKRQRSGGSYPHDGLLMAAQSKRLRASPGTVGQLWIGSAGYSEIFHWSVASLELVRSVDIQSTNWVNKNSWGPAGGIVNFNPLNDSLFVGMHFVNPSSIWFTAAGKFDSNPAHIIYECLTNTDWGMGAPSSIIDVPSFIGAATTLYAERFGLSMIWTQQATIEDFVTEVLDHIEATLFVNPRTGLLTLKLIRFDYLLGALPVFTPDNSVVANFSRKLWGETINEIVVTWTNPTTEEEETVVAQDLANIEAQGGIVSDGRNYYGVRRPDLAAFCGQRDLRSASTPLAKCDLEVNRAAWALLPGDVCILNSPEDGIDQLVMRVGPVDYGKPGESTVRVSLVEDVWSLALADYTDPPTSLWVDESETPTPADWTEIVTLPYFVAVNMIDAAVMEGVAYPEVFAGVLAAESGKDTDTYLLYGETTNAAGTVEFTRFGTKTIASRATLPADIPAEVETLIASFPDRSQGHGPIAGGLMIIQGADEATSEVCLIAASGELGYTLWRGVLDTVPRAWPAGTPVWFIDEGMSFADDFDIRAEGETVNYKVLTQTSRGTLSLTAAPIITETLTGRPHYPLRPANVLINDDPGFAGNLDLRGVDPIPVTWARRNRLTETAIVKTWDAGDVTPEIGQTTRVAVTTASGIVIHDYVGLAGTAQAIAAADFGDASQAWIAVSSARDGLDSLQNYRVHVQVTDNPTADSTMVTADTIYHSADEA